MYETAKNMNVRQNTWSVVLAAGDGKRLAALTADDTGHAVPKQFCALQPGRSFLDEALRRARGVVPHARTCAVVAASHERYWCNSVRTLPCNNVIVQPRNCGTAAGVLMSLLSVLELDPLARILFLPADHYVRHEWALAGALRATVALSARSKNALVLLGIKPDGPDSELGYIVPGPVLKDGSQRVAAFVEKPDTAAARGLLAAGALWNSFIFAASGASLLSLMRNRLGPMVEKLEAVFTREPRSPFRWRALTELYETLPTRDFSQDVVQNAEQVLRVVTAPACGWNDLGTPKRLADISALYRVQLSVPRLQL